MRDEQGAMDLVEGIGNPVANLVPVPVEQEQLSILKVADSAVGAGYVAFVGFMRSVIDQCYRNNDVSDLLIVQDEDDVYGVIVSPLFHGKLLQGLVHDIIKNNILNNYYSIVRALDRARLKIARVRKNAIVHLEDVDMVFTSAASMIVREAGVGARVRRLYPVHLMLARAVARLVYEGDASACNSARDAIVNAVGDACRVARGIVTWLGLPRSGKFACSAHDMLGCVWEGVECRRDEGGGQG